MKETLWGLALAVAIVGALTLTARPLPAPQGPAGGVLETVEGNRLVGHGSTRHVGTDGSTAIRIRWIGTPGSSGTVDIAADGNLVFTTDGTTADTSVSSDGTIDVSGASEDTFGEVAAAINASANWECILVDVLPSWSADNVLTDVAESDVGAAEAANGLSFKYNTADLDKASISIGPEYTIDADLPVTRDRLLNRRSTPLAHSAAERPWVNELYLSLSNATFTTTTAATFRVYAVKDDVGGATELTLWSSTGAATTALHTIDLMTAGTLGQDIDGGRPFAIRAPAGWRIVAAYEDLGATPAMTAATMQAHGLSYRQ